MTLFNLIQRTRKNRETYRVDPVGLTVGRTDSNGIVLTDPQTARRHSQILIVEGRCFMREKLRLGGTYTTYTNILWARRNGILAIGNR